MNRIIATIAVLSLFASAAVAAEQKDAVVATAAAARGDTAERNRNLAKSAHTAAVEDAIVAVLVANKRSLEIRLIGRTSVPLTGSR